MTVPWSLMPSLRDVDVVVSPSAELWYRSTTALPKPGRVLVAAGPDLKMAEREAAEVGSLYADALVLGPTQSTVGCQVLIVKGSATLDLVRESDGQRSR